MDQIKYALATERHLPAIKALLAESGLPPDDLELAIRHCLVAEVGSRVVGTVSLEIHVPFALLRSLAVAPDRRGQSIARHLVERIASYAQLRQVEQLFLLTTDADRFFVNLGFVHTERDEVPAEIQKTSQFHSVCPKSAACLTRRLAGMAFYAPKELLSLQPDGPGVRMWAVSMRQAMLTCFEVDPQSRFEMHHHESEQITTVLSGELFFDVDGTVHCVKAGEVIAIPSGVPHAVWTEEQPAVAMDAWSPVMKKYQTGALRLQSGEHNNDR